MEDKKLNKLRLYIYGKNALEDIKYLCKDQNLRIYNEDKYKNKVYIALDKESKESNWEYFILSGGIDKEKNEIIKNYLNDHFAQENMTEAKNEIKNLMNSPRATSMNIEKLNQEISKIIIRSRKFYDVLVILVDNLLDEDSQLVFNYFQNFTDQLTKQPFILFLTRTEDDPKIQKLFKNVTNEFFDKRNVYAYKFPKNEEEIEYIYKLFIKFMNYYHEISNNDIKSQTHSFNILVCGPAGAGKSTFINQFLQSKTAKEGEGLSITHEITNYIHPTYPINIFDTPGFEDNETVEKVYKTILKFEDDIRDSKNHIDLILYFNEMKERVFFAMETDLLKHLIKENKKMIIVMNDHGKKSKKERQRLLKIMKDSIEQIINTMDSSTKSRLEEIHNNIVLINLRQSIEDEEDDDDDKNNKKKIRQCYGMDELFAKIYSNFKKLTITEYNKIENAKDNIYELKNIIESFPLLSHIKHIEDLNINIKIECSKLILSYAKYDFFIAPRRYKRRQELLNKINTLNQGKSFDVGEKYNKLEYRFNNNSYKDDDIDEFFNSIRKFEGIFKIDGFKFNPWFYNKKTLLIGYYFLKEFQTDYGEYDEKAKNYLMGLCKTFNIAIDAFQNLTEEWIKAYSSLKKHFSDVEWINRFFIVEIPKN